MTHGLACALKKTWFTSWVSIIDKQNWTEHWIFALWNTVPFKINLCSDYLIGSQWTIECMINGNQVHRCIDEEWSFLPFSHRPPPFQRGAEAAELWWHSFSPGHHLAKVGGSACQNGKTRRTTLQGLWSPWRPTELRRFTFMQCFGWTWVACFRGMLKTMNYDEINFCVVSFYQSDRQS